MHGNVDRVDTLSWKQHELYIQREQEICLFILCFLHHAVCIFAYFSPRPIPIEYKEFCKVAMLRVVYVWVYACVPFNILSRLVGKMVGIRCSESHRNIVFLILQNPS